MLFFFDPRIKFDMASRSQFDYGATPIQTSTFSRTELNAYITNRLNKSIKWPEFCTFTSFVMRIQHVLIFWNKMAEKVGRCVFLLLPITAKYTCFKCINHFCILAVFHIWKRWDGNGLQSRQFGGVLLVMHVFESWKWQNEWILKKPTSTRTN